MGISFLKEEKKLWKRGYKMVVSLDEAGRGPLAGPVVAAAVSLDSARIKKLSPEIKKLLNEIKDSKKLTPAKREMFYYTIVKNPAIRWQTGRVSERMIDKINIKNAAELAMFRAVSKLKFSPDFLIIDGKFLKNEKLRNIKHKLIIKADGKVFSCIMSSIIAKVTRDRIMQRRHKKYPHYGFASHKGYPTKYHIKMLKKYGPCQIHRESFKPVKLQLGLDFLKT